jgi:hypothetical protein
MTKQESASVLKQLKTDGTIEYLYIIKYGLTVQLLDLKMMKTGIN